MSRDFQRSKLYAWETAVLQAEDDVEMTLDECNLLAQDIWSRERITSARIVVTDGRRRRAGYCTYLHGGGASIALPRHARRRWYVTHEVTHALIGPGEHHRQLFCRTYATMLQRYAGWTAVLRSMRAYGLKV